MNNLVSTLLEVPDDTSCLSAEVSVTAGLQTHLDLEAPEDAQHVVRGDYLMASGLCQQANPIPSHFLRAQSSVTFDSGDSRLVSVSWSTPITGVSVTTICG